MKQQAAVKLYFCQRCRYATPYRWVLSRHLVRVHRLSAVRAKTEALRSEYRLNPQPWSVGLIESAEKEATMEKVRTLRDILDKLADKNVDPENVVINPKSIQIIADDDETEDNEE